MNKKIKLLLAILTITLVAVSGIGVFVMQMQKNNNPTQTKPIKVACIGDSITAGFGYPEDLQKFLGEKYTVENFGFGGATVSLDGETPYMRDTIFIEAKTSQPNIVIIMLGTNDALPNLEQYGGSFINDYITLISEFQALASKPQIWLVKPPPIFHNGTGLSTEFFEQIIIPNIEEIAEKTHLPVIDVYSALMDRLDCFPYDGVHPNSSGAVLIANEVYKALNSK
jgi:acyl-CoA thioesterase I